MKIVSAIALLAFANNFQIGIAEELGCADDEFRCADGSKCIGYRYFCDSRVECDDGSDEILYNDTIHTDEDGIKCQDRFRDRYCLLDKQYDPDRFCFIQENCIPAEFRCASGTQCVLYESICDGHPSCRDGSDEVLYDPEIHTADDGIPCRGWSNLTRECLLPAKFAELEDNICNKDAECMCSFFKCSDGSKCVTKEDFCDGYPHCDDGSDEIRYDPEIHSEEDGLPCYLGEWDLPACLLPSKFKQNSDCLCDKISWCPHDQYMCPDSRECISKERFCDGKEDCGDGSDEVEFEPIVDDPNTPSDGSDPIFECTSWLDFNRTCLLKMNYMPEYICNTEKKCSPGFFSCSNGHQCVHKSQFCDGTNDCEDDEILYDPSNHTVGDGTPCRGWKDLSRICLLKPGMNSSGICNTDLECSTGYFRCSDGSACIPKTKFCDRVKDCEDGSDEIRYKRKHKGVHVGHKCRGWRNLRDKCLLDYSQDKRSICNPVKDCAPGFMKCANGFECFAKDQFCDGKEHCKNDGIDEIEFDPSIHTSSDGLKCTTSHGRTCLLSADYVPELEEVCKKQECPSGHFRCRGDQQCRSVIEFCDGIQNCEYRDDEIEYNATEHSPDDGVPCKGWLDLTKICLLSHEQNSSEICNTEMKCFGNDYFLCADKSACIPASDFCDGKQDCGDGSDEVPYDYASEGSIPCYSCQLRAEEAHKAEEICQRVTECAEDAFLCSDRSMCIHKHKFCDGKKDCRDGSDEERYKGTKNRLGEACRSWKNIRHQCLLTYASGQDVEKICNPVIGCGTGFYKCLNQVQCIPIDQFCDGNEDCRRNASDEMPIELFANTKIKGKSCLRNKRVCLFPSTADQTLFGEVCEDVTCGPDEFMCADGTQCVNKRLLCDQKRDCLDGTDEMVYNASEGIPGRQCNSWVYPNNECLLPETPFNTGKYNATALCNDDRECDGFLCTNGSKCISSSDFCQGENDCPDGSDEVVYNASIHTPKDGTSCKVQYYVAPCLLNPMNYDKRDLICED